MAQCNRAPVPDPRRCRPVRRRVRRDLPKRQHHDYPHATAHTGRERLPGTLGSHRAPRAPRPHPHLEPSATRRAPVRVRRALQRTPAPPQPRATPSRQRRDRRVPIRPTHPTIPHLRRTHQRVPPSSLNHPTNRRHRTRARFDAPAPCYSSRNLWVPKTPVTSLTCAFAGSSLSSRVGHAIDRLSFTASQFAQRGVDHGPRRVFALTPTRDHSHSAARPYREVRARRGPRVPKPRLTPWPEPGAARAENPPVPARRLSAARRPYSYGRTPRSSPPASVRSDLVV
jgi:hypothetical protein